MNTKKDERPIDDAKRQQVADQCKVVAHLAGALAKVHLDYEKLIREKAFDGLVEQIGVRTSSIMEELGDILNGMDAVSEEDEWTHPIFDARAAFGFGAIEREPD